MLQFKVLLSVLSTFCWITVTHSAEILGIFTFPARNHFGFNEAIMRSLLVAGHRVTVIAPFTSHINHINFTFVQSKTISSANFNAKVNEYILKEFSFLEDLDFIIRSNERQCHSILSMKEVKTIKRYDVMFVEIVNKLQCFMPLATLAINQGTPVIGTISSRSDQYSDSAVGNTRSPSFFPTMRGTTWRKITFVDRLFNFYSETRKKVLELIDNLWLQQLFQNIFHNLDNPNSKISLLFANDHTSTQERATSPNTINIGGIQVKSAILSPLTEPIKTFIEEADHGVILFSMGSIVDMNTSLPNMIATLKKAFEKIPQRVLCKSEGNIDGFSENVLLSPWLPQKEVLAHKNVLTFISHGGQGSLYEAIYFAKPIILLPIFADQPHNAALMQNLGTGLMINVKELNEAKLLDAIDEVINNTMYRENMLKLSRKFKDQPISPEELVVYWTEYVLRHKNFNLRTTEADVPLYQYLLLDVITFVLCVMVFTGFLLYFIIKKIFQCSSAKKTCVREIE